MGIPIVAGTDTSYTAASLSSVAGEVRLLGEFGLSNLDALRSATTTAATLVGLERELGRLRPGYAADALVVGANPLSDLGALANVRLVVAGGWVAHEAPERVTRMARSTAVRLPSASTASTRRFAIGRLPAARERRSGAAGEARGDSDR